MKTASATQPSVPDPRIIASKLTNVKKSLVQELSREFADRLPLALIRRAIDEEDELAHSTGYPHLVLPLLAEETVRRVSELTFDHEQAGEPALAVAC